MKKTLLLAIALLTMSCGDIQESEQALDSAGVNTLVSAPAFTYTDCAVEWASCKFTGVKTVRFGATVKGVDRFITKQFTAQNLYPDTGIRCRNDVFGTDPASGFTKSCAIQNTPVVVTPPSTDTATYAQCGIAWNWCTFGAKAITANVRFGSDKGGWTPAKLITPAAYGTQCNYSAFAAKDPCPSCAEVCQIVTGSVTPPAPVVDASVPPPKVDASVPPPVPVKDASVPPPPPVDAGGPVVVVPPPTTGNRPSSSKGTGFYVVGTKLYDANGNEFRMRGTNKTHQDNMSPGLGKAGSNATRWLVYFGDQPARNIADMQSPNIGGSTVNGKAVAIPGFWDGTCKSDSGTFNTMVDRWVRDAKVYQTFERYMILNIANEWGDNAEAWRDAYIAAIPKIRAAGWHGAILVDAPGCGQNPAAVIKYGRAVFNSDPEANVMFDLHIYGYWRDTVGGVPTQWTDTPDLRYAMDALKATGLTIIIGEFGPGRNVGPSPTMITSKRIIQEAEAHGFGWLSWSWDDNNMANGVSDDNSFSHSYNGQYNSSADLTQFGKVVVEDPEVGWKAIAQTCSIFK